MYDINNNDILSKFVEDFKRVQKDGFKKAELQELTNGVWWDWFCRDTSLPNKTIKLGIKVCSIAKSPRINPNTMYVFFKNNSIFCGGLYDDFRICSRKDKEVIYNICPNSPRARGKAQVFGKENKFKDPLVEGTWADVKKYFKV